MDNYVSYYVSPFQPSLSTVNPDYVEPEEAREEQGLSETAIIGIAASSAVAGVAIIAAWIAVIACCCVLSVKRSRGADPSQGFKNETYE
jgi:hypothetical protein